MKKGIDMSQKAANLVGPKKVFLPKTRIHMHYYEREATTTTTMASENSNQGGNQQRTPTIVFCHGLSDVAQNLGRFIASLEIPSNVRILCPEQIGHGMDLKQSVEDPSHYREPSHKTADLMLESTCEFLDAVNVGPTCCCNVFGISMGGALAYFLQIKRPDIVQKSVLVSPAIPACMDDQLIDGILSGTNSFLNIRSRDDIKFLFRDMLWTGPYATDPKADRRKRKYPIPKFLFEAMYRKHQTNVPKEHYKKLVRGLIASGGLTTTTTTTTMNDGDGDGDGDHHGGNDNPESLTTREKNNNNDFAVASDLDRNSPRLVICPEDDQLCDCTKTRRFFERSIVTSTSASASASTSPHHSAPNGTIYKTIPDCGHVFHLDGRLIYDVVSPIVRDYLIDFSG